MPAATTHVEFARDLYHHLSSKEKATVTDLPMYYLGAQGPDLFFFSHAAILPHSLRKYGNQMHREKIQETNDFLVEYSQGNPHLQSYVAGYLSHYALDSITHPLIRYCTKQEYDLNQTPEAETHIRIEATVDCWILKQKNRTIQDYNVYDEVRVSDDDSILLGQMYHQMFLKVFGYDIPEAEIQKTAWDAYKLLKALKPNHISKYRFAKAVESLVRKPHLVSAMMLYDKEIPIGLNEEHHTYEVFGQPNKTDSRSFADLYEDALKYAESVLKDPLHQTYTVTFLGEEIQK